MDQGDFAKKTFETRQEQNSSSRFQQRFYHQGAVLGELLHFLAEAAELAELFMSQLSSPALASPALLPPARWQYPKPRDIPAPHALAAR